MLFQRRANRLPMIEIELIDGLLQLVDRHAGNRSLYKVLERKEV
jgi:hypothetical protein